MKKILLVDDDSHMRTLLKKMISPEKYEVIECENGLEAFELYNEHFFHVIITDLEMPVIDGMTFIKKIKSTDLNNETNILVLSGNRSSDTIIDVMKKGVFDYLIKPVNAFDLNKKIDNAYEIAEIERVKHDLEKYEKEELIKMATVDSLTNLFNRGYFMTCFSNEFKRYLRFKDIFTFAMFDIDHFKTLNDTYGHQCGDFVLIHFSDFLSRSFRELDIAGRVGGEEFAVIFPNTEKGKILDNLRKFCEKWEAYHLEFSGNVISSTVSIGLTEVTESDEKISDIMNRADEALYNSKEKGRNQVTVR